MQEKRKARNSPDRVARLRPTGLAPEWEERLERLCLLTNRTSLILELCGLDKSARSRIKDAIDRSCDASGVPRPIRPRGQAASYDSGNFLETLQERYDAAYLLSLHYPRGTGEFSETEVNLGRALDKRMEAYLQYLANLYPRQTSGRVSFETYCELLRGVQGGGVEVHTCRDCGSRHPVPATRLGHPVCPTCFLLRPKIGSYRSDFQQRMEQAGSGPATQGRAAA